MSISKLFTGFSILLFIFSSVLPFSAQAEEKKAVRAAIAVDSETKPTSSFASDVPKLYAFYIAESIEVGDVLRGVWIAEDVGNAAPKNTKIDEASITIKSEADKSGAFSLTKPNNGWPVGDYRVEIYLGKNITETVKFQISNDEEPDGDSSQDDAAVEEETEE